MRRDDEETTEFAAFVLHETSKAILVQEAEKLPEFWLPKSKITELSRKQTRQGEVIVVEVPYWLAKEKGIV